jgi:DNA-binding transcriptional LysR family regulator
MTHSLSLIASPIPATYLIGPAIALLLEQYPDATLQLNTASWQQQLSNPDGFDLGVIDVSELHLFPALECERLIQSRAKICCRNDHPLLLEKNLTVKQLSQYPIALPNSLPSYVSGELSRLLELPLINQQCKATLHYDSLSTVRHTMINSNMLAIAPSIAVTQSLNNQLTGLSPIDWPTIDAEFGIVKPKAREVTDLMNAMMDCLFSIAELIRNDTACQ